MIWCKEGFGGFQEARHGRHVQRAAFMKRLQLLDLSHKLVRYADGIAIQDNVISQLRAGVANDTLILLQHNPVYTIGKRGGDQDFKVPKQELQAQGIDIHPVPRGGEVTWHGPGQLVAYPVIGLKAGGRGARVFVEGIEDVLVATLGRYGVAARGRVPGATGVWVGDSKIAAIGVKISHGVSSHGLALNICNDLSPYDAIIPCGIRDKGVTSLAVQLAALRAQQPGGVPSRSRIPHAVQASTASSDSASGSTSSTISDDVYNNTHASGSSTVSSHGSVQTHSSSIGVQGTFGYTPGVEEVAGVLVHEFCKRFGYPGVELSRVYMESPGPKPLQAAHAG